MTWPRMDGLRTLELGTPGELRQELVGLVLAGPKRATAGLLGDYEIEGEALETPGEQLVLVGDDGRRVGLVEITEVEVVEFAEVSDDFARAEGEASPVTWTGPPVTGPTGNGSGGGSTTARPWSACGSSWSDRGSPSGGAEGAEQPGVDLGRGSGELGPGGWCSAPA